jgi:hypothetical protein
MGFLIANLLVLAINLGVLGISIKIYSEYLKDKQFESRAQRPGGPKV